MKMYLLTTLMVLILSIGSFAQNEPVDKILKNQESKTELFNAIQNDHQLMIEFMQNMHGNEHAMMMWKNDQMMGKDKEMNQHQMMGEGHMMGTGSKHQMMDKSNMMEMMHNNPEMMRVMMSNMVDVCATDSAMSHNMINQMSQHPQMMKMMKNQMMMKSPGKEMKSSGQHHMNLNKDKRK